MHSCSPCAVALLPPGTEGSIRIILRSSVVFHFRVLVFFAIADCALPPPPHSNAGKRGAGGNARDEAYSIAQGVGVGGLDVLFFRAVQCAAGSTVATYTVVTSI